MPSSRDIVILFTRYPHPGKCKTRLVPTLGRDGAAQIHRHLVSHTIRTLTEFITSSSNSTYRIYYDGASPESMKQWLGQHRFTKQQGEDIGERMAEALVTELKTETNCILIGSDCPDINPLLLQEAFQALKRDDLVLGPACDGGYYLIGVNNSSSPETIRQLFKKIPWSSSRVLETTIQRTQDLKLRFHLLQKLHDIDTPDDLKYFHHHSHTQ